MTLFQIIPMLILSSFKENGVLILTNIGTYKNDPNLMDEHFKSIPQIFYNTINSLKILTFFSQVGTFLIPSLLIFWRFKNIPLHFKKIDLKGVYYLLVPFLILLGISQLLVQFSLYIGYDFLPNSVSTYLENEQLFSTKIQDYFVTKNGLNLLLNIGLMAILPATAEELFFRGILQPLFIRLTSKKMLGILITSVIFSILHFQIDHFLAILFASIILGIIYQNKMNIYLNMLLHFAFNCFSLLSLFLIKNSMINETNLELVLNYGLIPIGIILLIFSIKRNGLKLV